MVGIQSASRPAASARDIDRTSTGLADTDSPAAAGGQMYAVIVIGIAGGGTDPVQADLPSAAGGQIDVAYTGIRGQFYALGIRAVSVALPAQG